jgi:SAM-dependent methyltransferase
MPTLPADSPSHRFRQAAESFGAEAERYDRARPRYPQAMVDRIVAAAPGPDLLDVGVGTGIAARQFRDAGCRVLGVDVDERMASVARGYGIDVEVAKFEDWDPAGRTFDVVIAGQTWHWVDPTAGAAAAARVLRPGGRLALFWNAVQPPAAVTKALTEIYRRVLPDLPPMYSAQDATAGYTKFFDAASAGIARAGAFGVTEQWRFDREQHYTRDEYVDVIPTSGIWAQIPAADQQTLLDDVGAAIDALGGGVTVRYDAIVLTAVRT